jgi:putative nucleotidyltransferase with HDIG domain
VAEVKETAAGLLSSLADRWQHTRSVAARAEELAAAVPVCDRGLLVVAAWWHDLGYSPALRVTGLHQLDGARYLAEAGYPARLCALVAHHSAATAEAEERGLLAELNEWPREETAVSDALWTADMTTGPRGERVDYPTRLAEILERYDADSPVARAMRRARPMIEAAISRTEARLAG